MDQYERKKWLGLMTEQLPYRSHGKVVFDGGDIYGVAANWIEASSPVLSWQDDAWEGTQWQVADFRHRPGEALVRLLAACGYNEEVAESMMEDSIDIASASTLITITIDGQPVRYRLRGTDIERVDHGDHDVISDCDIDLDEEMGDDEIIETILEALHQKSAEAVPEIRISVVREP